MIELGYMAKRIISRPDWLDVPGVRDVYAVSNCMSNDFCDYIDYWKHNGFWFFDSPALIRAVATENDIDLTETVLVYYRGYHMQYDADLKKWTPYQAEADFRTAVSPPTDATFLGYDIVTYSMQNMPECSPLSCNKLAADVRVNEHCLIDSLGDAIDRLNIGAFNNSEPGPYRIIAVHAVDRPGVG